MKRQGRAVIALGRVMSLLGHSFFLMLSLLFLFTHFCLCSFEIFMPNSFLLLCNLSLNLSGSFHQSMSGIWQSCV